MVPYLGDFAEDATVYMPLNSFDSNKPSASVTITNLADADIHVHKDGGTTEIATDGATVAIDYDGITGNHLVTIDTSVDAEYSTGSDYHVRMEGTTIDGGTVNAWVGHFSIENRHSAAAIAAVKSETALIVADTNELQVDWTNGGRLDTILDGVDSLCDLILADTNELQSDWANGGRLDTILDATLVDTDELQSVLSSGVDAETHDDTLIEQLKVIRELIEIQRRSHTHQGIGNIFHVDPDGGATHASGARGGVTDPYLTIQDCHDNAVTDSNHDVILLVSGTAAGSTTHSIAGTTTISKRYTFIRGPGRDFIITRTGNGDTLAVTADGVEFSGFQLGTAATGSGNGIQVTDADFMRSHHVWINDTQGDGINILRGDNCQIHDCVFTDTGQGGSGEGVHVVGTAGTSNRNHFSGNIFHQCAGDGILIEDGTTNQTFIHNNTFEGCTGFGINIGASSTDAFLSGNHYGNNTSGAVNDSGTTTTRTNDEERAKHSIATEARLAELDAANLPTVVDAIKVITDALGATAAANLALSAGSQGIISATVDTVTNTHTPLITEFQCDDVTEATADHFNGRVVIFLTGVLAGQATDITGYAAVGGIGQFTVTALTEAPSNNDTMIIV